MDETYKKIVGNWEKWEIERHNAYCCKTKEYSHFFSSVGQKDAEQKFPVIGVKWEKLLRAGKMIEGIYLKSGSAAERVKSPRFIIVFTQL